MKPKKLIKKTQILSDIVCSYQLSKCIDTYNTP